MKYKCVFIATGLAIMACVGSTAKADQAGQADDLLNQLAAYSSNGNTDKSTAGLLKTLIALYRTYIEQVKTLADGTDSPAMNPPAQNTAATPAQPSQDATTAASAPAAQTAAPTLPAPSLQTAQLQTGQLQPGGPLREVHLAGYPALPAGSPVSSITNPTSAQLESATEDGREQAKIKRLMFERWDNNSD